MVMRWLQESVRNSASLFSLTRLLQSMCILHTAFLFLLLFFLDRLFFTHFAVMMVIYSLAF